MLEVVYEPVGRLMGYAGNAKEHTARQIDQIKNSIREFGFNDPIGVWTNAEGKSEVVEGHGRLQAALELGIAEVPVIHLDELTDEQRRAYTLAHNQLTMSTGWDMGALQREMDALAEYDFCDFGFEPEVTDEMADAACEFEDTDAADPEQVEPRIKRGEVWQLGEHRLMCGDSTSQADVGKLMGGEEADLLVTDPPYNVAYEGGTKDKLTIKNDDMGDAQFRSFLTDALACACAVMRPGAAFYVWHASMESRNFHSAAIDSGLDPKQCIVWNKSAIALGRQDYQWKHELCLYGWRPGAAHYFVSDRTLATVWDGIGADPARMTKAELQELVQRALDSLHADVWDFDKPSRSEMHPTMKPVPLMGRCVLNSSRRGGGGSRPLRRQRLDDDGVRAERAQMLLHGARRALRRGVHQALGGSDRRRGSARGAVSA